jgi:hypothetical protein
MSTLNPFGGYVKINVGEIPVSKLRKAFNGQRIKLTNADLSGDRIMIVHPLNKKLIEDAKKKNKGLMTTFTQGEIDNDLDFHERAGGSLHGGSLWSWLKKAGKSVYNFAKDNWSDIKPIVSKGVDALTQSAAEAAGPYAPGVILAREGLRKVSGVGLKPSKGSDEMKERMKALRALRKSGGSMSAGSFRMP